MTRTTTLFTKCPRPGVVKTRLSPPLSPERSAQLAEAMLLDTAERLGSAAHLGPRLAFAEADAEPWFEQHVPWLPQRAAQVGDGLGQRLAKHFELQFSRPGQATAVVLGSDQPLVPIERYAEAHARLEAGADVVLGPDQGGGYYLIGLRASRPSLLLDVTMSSAGMFEETTAAAQHLDLRVAHLEPELDVDRAQDLRALHRAIESDPAAARARAPRTTLLVEQLRFELASS